MDFADLDSWVKKGDLAIGCRWFQPQFMDYKKTLKCLIQRCSDAILKGCVLTQLVEMSEMSELLLICKEPLMNHSLDLKQGDTSNMLEKWDVCNLNQNLEQHTVALFY